MSDDGASSSAAAAAAAASTAVTPVPAAPAAAAAADTAAASSTAAEPASSSAEHEAGAAADGASSVPVVRMKKVRKRTALKSSTTALDDDDDSNAAGAGAGAAEGGAAVPSAASLQTIRLMQKLRSKSATVLSLGESDLHLPGADVASAAESAGGAAAAAGGGGGGSLLGKEFGAEGKDAQAALIDQQMEKYIAEQMAAQRALRQPQKKQQEASQSDAAAAAAPVNLSEDQLFVTPEHLKIHNTQSLEEAEESGERWLTGIAEYSVSIKDKMANIEKTEAAKAKMLAEHAKRRDVSMVLPANYNSNFKLHKKEWDGKRREEFRAFHDAQNRAQALAQGLPPPPPSQPWARDMPPAPTDARALPGFLAGPEEPRRDWAPRAGAAHTGQGGTQRGHGVPNATDDRVVDRFIKRFKYK